MVFCEEDGLWYQKIGVALSLLTLPVGECYMANNATQTTIVSTASYVKIAGTTIAGQNINFTAAIPNRLTYIGIPNKIFRINCFVTISQPNGNNQDMYLALFKNGVLLTSSESNLSNTSTNQKIPITSSAPVLLATNEYVEAFVRNATGTNNILVRYMNLNIG